MATRTDLFTWRFFDEMAWWAMGASVLVALVGAFVTHGWSFPVTCLVVTAADVALVHLAARRGGAMLEAGTLDRGALLVFGSRFVLKVVALAAALAFPTVIDFWGAVAGALVYDTVLAAAGSVVSAARVSAAGR